jgi:hypothetical protein
MGDRIKIVSMTLAMIIPLFCAMFILTQEVTGERAGSFVGTWIASGQHHAFDFLEGREINTFRVKGHVNLKDNLGEMEDYWADCVGLSDSVTGCSSRCVWQNMEGDKAYIVLTGRPLEKRVKVSGEFVGGTGSLLGIEGKFTFTWSYVFTDQNLGIFTGQTKDLRGSYRIR